MDLVLTASADKPNGDFSVKPITSLFAKQIEIDKIPSQRFLHTLRSHSDCIRLILTQAKIKAKFVKNQELPVVNNNA